MRETQWKIYLANSSDPTQNLADLTGATNIKVSVGLNKSGNVSVTIPLISEAASIVEPITTCLVLYAHGEAASNVAVWSGPVWTLEESAQNNTLSINAVGWFELLNHRIIQTTATQQFQNFAFMNPSAASNASYWVGYNYSGASAKATIRQATWDFDSSPASIMVSASIVGADKYNGVDIMGLFATNNFYYDHVYRVSGRLKLTGSIYSFPSGGNSNSHDAWITFGNGPDFTLKDIAKKTGSSGEVTAFIGGWRDFSIEWQPSKSKNYDAWNWKYPTRFLSNSIAGTPSVLLPHANGFFPAHFDDSGDGTAWFTQRAAGYSAILGEDFTPFFRRFVSNTTYDANNMPVSLVIRWQALGGPTVAMQVDSLTATYFQVQPPYVAYASTDAGVIVNNLMTLTAQTYPLGMTLGTVETTTPRTRSYKRYDNLGRAIQELSDAESGFDWTIDPLTKKLNIWERLGVTQEDVVFGFRAGPSNLRDASRKTDSSILANDVLVAGKFGIFEDKDVASASVYGKFEDYISLQEVGDPNILDAYSSIEVAFRSQPRELHTFNPYSPNETFRVPRLHRDYWLGDIVFFSANYGRMQVDRQPVRIYEVSFTIDSEGNEKIDSLGTSADSSA